MTGCYCEIPDCNEESFMKIKGVVLTEQLEDTDKTVDVCICDKHLLELYDEERKNDESDNNNNQR